MPDFQAAHEATLSLTLAAQGGANVIYGSGMLESGMCVDFAKMVLDCEMIRMIKTVIRGVAVNDETLALDVIKEVGAGGQFLASTHTLERCRTEHAKPELFDRSSRDNWMISGGKETVEKAYEKAIEIVNTHKPLPLPEDVASKLRTIIADVETEYGVRK